MKQKFKWLLALVAMVASINLWAGDVTYERLTSIANIDESAQYVLGIDGTGFHYEGTSSWGKTALPSAQTPLYYTLKKANDGKSFTAQTTISSTTYYLQIPTSNTFGMVTNTGTNTDLIIGTTFDAGDGKDYAVANKGTTARHLRRNGDSGLRSYASGTGALAFFYKVVSGDTPVEPTAPSITTQPEGASYEKDATATALTVAASGNPTPAYQWYSNTTNSTTGASAISGETNASYTPSTATIGTKYYYCVASNSEGSAISNIVAVTVTAPLPKITITADKIADFTSTYGEYTWTANAVSGKCWAYQGGSSGNYNIQFNKTSYIYNTTAVSGRITSIKMTKVAGNTRSWSIYGADEALTGDNYTTTGTQIGSAQEVSSETGTTWNVPSGQNYTYFYITKADGGTNIGEIVITYEELAPTNEAVTFAAPEGGSLVIKNGATPIATGATIQDGTILDVTFGMTPAEAYKDVAIKVTNTTTSADVTSTVYNSETQKITMPRYPITVSVTFTKLYAISVATAGEGEGTATINGGTSTIYVSADDEITLVAEPAAGSEFSGWTASNENIIFDNASSASTTALAGAAGTITATFGVSALLPLDAPTLSAPTNITYNSVTLNWQELANADGYKVEIWLDNVRVVYDSSIGETYWTPDFTFQANTTYTYTVQGVGDGSTYAEENNPKATSTFKTADYPAATLTLSENGETSELVGKLNTPITLPTESTQACDGKVFMGWSEDAIEGEVGKEQVTLLGATYTFDNPSVLTKTIYAVYAKKVEGDKYFEKVSSAPADWCGKYLIVYETGNLAMDGSLTTLDAVSNTKAVTISNSKIAWSQDMEDISFTIAYKTGSSTVYSLKSASGKYISGTTTSAKASNGMKQADTDADYEISFSGIELQSKSSDKQMVLKYNKADNQTRFRFYSSGQEAIALYKYSATIDYSNYCTTCEAAVAAPTFSLDEGEYNEAQTLTLSAAEGDIYYTINDGEEIKYTAAIALNNRGTCEISAYAKVDDRTSETVTKTYTLDWPYTSLAELAAADIPSGTEVTISFENAVIKSLATGYSIKGVYFDVQKEGKDIEIYCNSTAIPENWKVGGTLSVTNLTCAWVRYPATGNLTCWELTPSNWDDFTYNDPVHMTSIAISGEPTNKDYSAGQQLNPAGLVVTGYYNDHTEQVPHKEVITEGLTWTLPTLAESATSAQVSVKYTEPILSTELTSDPYQVTINAVTPAKTLQSIYVAENSTHKTEFFVGRPFSSDGLKVMAKYNIGEDQAIVPTSVTPPAMTSAGTKQVTVSYTEGGVTADAITYDITLTYMDLNDLVAATDINDHDHVYVKFEDVMITNFVNKGILLNVQKGDKDIEIYNQSANYPNTWAQYGTVSATLDDVEWTTYQGTWEFKISDWDDIEYTVPNIPVTSMEISPAEVSVGEAKTTTLSIVYTPNNATNTGVTWAVTEGSEYASVDEEGVVTGHAVGTATITATLTADPTITATRTVTVTETAKCEISYYVKGEVASTQNIAREEEGTLTYEPELVVAGYTFAGWAEAAIAEEAATATLISTYTPAADEATKNVYAIYKRVDDSSPTYQKYAKVTSALTDWAGDYLLVYEDEGTAYVWTGVDAASCNVTATIDGNVISSKPDGAVSLTIAAMTDGYSIQVKGGTNDGKYIGKNASGNGMDIGASAYKNTISISENNAVITGAGGNKMRYNTANDQKRFRYYGSGQQAVQLYKYDEGSALYTSNPVAKVKVTFNLDGGVGGCGTITVNEGEDAVLCEDAPTKDLNKFDAWSDGANKYAPGATIENVTEDIELTALWIAKQQYTISFNKAGAAGTKPADITDYEYNEVTLPVQGDLSNPGYIFGGWNDGEITYAGGASFTMPEKNVSMTAVWVAKTNDKWVLVTSTNQLVTGSKYVIANNENDAVAGDITGSNAYMNKVDATFSDNKQFITGMTGQVELTLGGSTDAWTFAKDASNYLANSGTSLSWSTTASTWKIAFEDDEMTIVEGTNNSLQYNTGSPRFKTYTSSQAAVQLYVLVPAQAINEDVNASTLDAHADVTVNEGGNLLVTEGDIELGDIYVMEGGKVTISGTATLTVSNFVIKSTMGGGKSGQVIGVTTTENFTINGNAYFDITLGAEGDPNQWHAFAVPFNVDAINGVYDLDDNKLTNEVNYAIMDYHGDVRAQGQYGWKKFRGIMQPGVFYLMTVDGERTTYRMKMNGGFHASSSTITVNQYASGTDTDAGWNGIANNQLGYSSIGVDVQVLNPTTYTYKVMTASEYNFTVGTPFFYQANATGTIDLTAPNAGANYAPRMTAEAKNIAITLGNDNYTDRLYISATDEATNEYQIGRDLVKMTMTNTPAVPQIFAEAYGTKLCMVDAPMMYDQAVYVLNLYAPANGEYTMGAAQVEGYEVFLVQNGTVIWNLSMSETSIALNKGNNTGYGLILKANGASAPTNMENMKNQKAAQKFIFNSNIYIRHNNKTFDVTGQLVK